MDQWKDKTDKTNLTKRALWSLRSLRFMSAEKKLWESVIGQWECKIWQNKYNEPSKRWANVRAMPGGFPRITCPHLNCCPLAFIKSPLRRTNNRLAIAIFARITEGITLLRRSVHHHRGRRTKYAAGRPTGFHVGYPRTATSIRKRSVN